MLRANISCAKQLLLNIILTIRISIIKLKCFHNDIWDKSIRFKKILTIT